MISICILLAGLNVAVNLEVVPTFFFMFNFFYVRHHPTIMASYNKVRNKWNYLLVCKLSSTQINNK